MKSLKRSMQALIVILALILATEAFAVGQKSEVVSTSGGKKTVQYIYYHPSESVELKPVLAQEKVGRTESLSNMAKTHNGIAAINGTFFNAYVSTDLQPMGAVMIDRDTKHFRGGPTTVGISTDNQLQFFATDTMKIYGGINGSREWPNKWYAWFINHIPTADSEIVIFTNDFRTNQLNFNNFTFVVVDQGKVTAITKNKATVPSNGFVIAYGPTGNQDQLNKFKVGDSVEYDIESSNTNTVNHLVSAGPKLVTNGQIDVNFKREGITDPKLTSQSSLRSFIGKKQDGTVIMGTVNKATIRQLAEVAQKLGLVEAMNLDGGASSGLYYQGKYMTSPGRNISNSLVLVKKERTPRIQVNREEIFLRDAKAYIENGTTMVPVRGVFEALGVAVSWDGPTKTVIAKRLNTEIILTVGSKTATVNGQSKPLINAPTNRGGRVYIPLRFVSESLGADVQWDQQHYLVTIKSSISTSGHHYQKALDLIKQNQDTEAIAELELATQLNSINADAWIQLGQLYSKRQNYMQATHAYQQVSNDSRVHIPLGWAAYSAQQWDVAEVAFTRALNQSETVIAGHYGLGSTYAHFSNRNEQKAKQHLNKVIELAPNSEQAKHARTTLSNL